MLNVYFGPMPEAIYNTAVYFKNTYEDKWITAPLAVEMIADVDHWDMGTVFLSHSTQRTVPECPPLISL